MEAHESAGNTAREDLVPRPLLRIPAARLTEAVRCGITTRVGFPEAGVGEADTHSRHGARTILANVLGTTVDRASWVKQVHGAKVLRVGTPGFQGEADGLVAAEGSHLLLVSVADCGPVLLADTAGTAIGAVHAGWRGVVAGVLEAAVEELARCGAPASRLRAWVGPSIGPDRFEVGPEVAAQFPDDVVLAADRHRPKPHVDLKRAIALRLVGAGLDADRVTICPDCTYDRPELYWSYRRDGGICGRQLGFVTGAR